MRRVHAALLAAALVTSACSDERLMQPSAPTSAGTTAMLADPADSARIAELIEGSQTLIQGLFGTYPNCTGNCNAAMTKFDQIAELYTVPPPYNMTEVVNKTYDLIAFILNKYEDGTLNDPPGAEGVTELVNLLYQYAGIDASICDIGADCDFGYYQPGSPAFTLIAPSGWASLQAPPGTGTVTLPTVLSLYRLTPDNDLSMLYLETQLDQYPLQYEFTTSSGEEFLQDVTITVCLADDVFPPDASRLKLAHNVAEPEPFENIQILPTAGSGTLICNGAATTDQVLETSSAGHGLLREYAVRGLRALAGALSPQPLHAALVAGTGITGTTKNLSPFGIVDYLGLISANSSTSIAALEGTAVEAPSVLVATPTQSPMAGIAVTFSITGGDGCFEDPCGPSSPETLVIDTDANGYATVPAWTIGSGSNTVTASASIPCAAPVATGTLQDCGTILTAEVNGEPSLTFSATGLPAVTNIAPASLSDGVEGMAYPSTSFTASGGDGTYSWAVTSGALPAGLTLAAGGTLSGTPTANGSFSFTVTVTSGPLSAQQSYSLTVYPPLAFTGPATLPASIQGQAYPATAFTVTGGDGSYSWSISSGALPAGLSVTGGSLSGTPTANGTFNFTVQVTSGPASAAPTATRSYSLTIYPPVTITSTSPLPTAIIGLAYPPQTLQASGGTGTYAWSLVSGSLPAGLGLSGATVSGTPTATGTSTFSVTASSTVGTVTGSDTKAFSITVGYPSAVALSIVSQPSGSQCYAVNQTIPFAVKVTTTGGTPIAGVPVRVIAVLNNGSTVVVSPSGATTDATGVATFSGLSINKAGGYQLRVGTTSPWPATSILSGKFKISPKC